MPVTEQQARAIAFLAASARPHGARRWDEAGIYANVMKVADRSLAGVVIAVMQAVEDRNAQSPGVIPTPGPHWRAPESAPVEEPRPRFDARQICHVCGKPKTVCNDARDHPFLSVEAARARRGVPPPDDVRAAIKSPELCRHGVARDHCAEHDPRRNQSKPVPTEETA